MENRRTSPRMVKQILVFLAVDARWISLYEYVVPQILGVCSFPQPPASQPLCLARISTADKTLIGSRSKLMGRTRNTAILTFPCKVASCRVRV